MQRFPKHQKYRDQLLHRITNVRYSTNLQKHNQISEKNFVPAVRVSFQEQNVNDIFVSWDVPKYQPFVPTLTAVN